MHVPSDKRVTRKVSATLASRWLPLGKEITEASALGAVWIQISGAAEPTNMLRQITLAEAQQMRVTHWAPALVTDDLSAREYQIFLMLARGKTVTEISAGAYLSVKTVSTYRKRVMEKTGLSNNVEIAMYAFRMGLVDWPRESAFVKFAA